MLHGNDDKENNDFAVGVPMTFSSHKFPMGCHHFRELIDYIVQVKETIFLMAYYFSDEAMKYVFCNWAS